MLARIFSLRCPDCESQTVRRSAVQSYERLLLFIGVCPYRCMNCDRRFYKIGIDH